MKQCIKFRGFEILRHGGAGDQCIVVKMPYDAVILIALVVQRIGQCIQWSMEVEKWVNPCSGDGKCEEDDQRKADTEDAP